MKQLQAPVARVIQQPLRPQQVECLNTGSYLRTAMEIRASRSVSAHAHSGDEPWPPVDLHAVVGCLQSPLRVMNALRIPRAGRPQQCIGLRFFCSSSPGWFLTMFDLLGVENNNTIARLAFGKGFHGQQALRRTSGCTMIADQQPSQGAFVDRSEHASCTTVNGILWDTTWKPISAMRQAPAVQVNPRRGGVHKVNIAFSSGPVWFSVAAIVRRPRIR